jgi:glycosyltransferase involved in cell wall biosynthesis
MNKVPISVIIPIRNEAGNLPRCLDSIDWADEIFVVDSESTDESGAIAGQHGAKVVQFHFNGTWPKKKNWALENLPFKNEWVLILDADEVLPPEARDEIANAIGNPGIAGYWINRYFIFLGRRLKHAYYPNWNLRLFRRALGRYEQLTAAQTDSGDNEVHEHVNVRGATGRLTCEMAHHAFPTVEVFMEKHNRYSNWEAAVAVEGELKNENLGHESVGFRRRVKSLVQRLPFRPFLRFLYVYIWQKGFLDGRDGYYFARLHAIYEFLSVAKTYELRKRLAERNPHD